MIKALIIDDEKLSRDLIREFLKPYDNIEVVGECENGFDGLKAILELQPALLFLDVQMPKLTGFEMVELLDEVPVIIFSTAFDQYALKAFELSAADYLLKPYSEERFREAVEKALQKIAIGNQKENIRELVDQVHHRGEKLDRLVVKTGSKIIIIPVEKILLIKAEDDYVAIYSDASKYLKQMTMKVAEEILPNRYFIRVHRSYIVNINFIDRLEAYSKDSYMALLKNGEKVLVSKSGYQALKEVLNF